MRVQAAANLQAVVAELCHHRTGFRARVCFAPAHVAPRPRLPGVASRLEFLGVAEVVQPGKLTAARLRAAIEKVLRISRHRENTLRRQEEIRKVNGPALAADIAEQAFTTRREVLRKK